MVDVTYVKDLNEVYLSEIKADPFFQDFPLVKQARLVVPVTLKQWKKLINMSEKMRNLNYLIHCYQKNNTKICMQVF